MGGMLPAACAKDRFGGLGFFLNPDNPLGPNSAVGAAPSLRFAAAFAPGAVLLHPPIQTGASTHPFLHGWGFSLDDGNLRLASLRA